MLRIVMLVFNQTGKGTFLRALGFGRALVQNGHQVTLLSTSPRSRLRLQSRWVDGVRLVEAPDLLTGSLRSGWDGWNTLRRIAWLGGQTFDLAHAFECRPTALYPALALRRRGIPVVIDWADWFGRGGSVEERPNPLVRTVLRPVETFFEESFRPKADGNTVICSTLQAKALSLGVKATTLRLLPNGSDLERFPPLEIATARRAAGIPPGSAVVGYVGTIFRKDALLMARAFDRLVEQLPNAHLVVAGHCPVDIRPLTRFPEAVVQSGVVPDEQLHSLLAACNVFWLPLCDTNANRGRWPYKLNDYLAIGRPVVATAVGDVSALLAEEAVGLPSSAEPEDFATQTLRLLADPLLQESMGRRARQVAEERFNWTRLAATLEGLYLQVISDFHQRS